MENNHGYEFEGDQIPKFVVKMSHEAKLKELLRNITSVEVKLCSDASKEFIKLLKGDTGGELLREYIQTSSKCAELLQAWKIRQGKPGFSYVLSLISAILNHPDGKYKAEKTGGTAMSRALDKFARLILEEKLGDIYKELSAKEAKSQNSALLLLASIVKRGSVLASDVAKNFDFKLPVFPKLAEYKKKRQTETKRKHSTRQSFIGFAMSFLEVGKPGLLRWVIQQKEMFSGILRGLGSDDDEVICHVLSTLLERVLTPESLVPPGLRSVLFGSVTLEQLLIISGRENGGFAAEIAHKVLLNVCTDPSTGLMPDLKRNPNPLRGNTKRLLDLMKKLKATDIGYHRDLLLAIVNGRPSFGSAYLDEFPYNLEDHTSPTWSAAVSLAANLVSSVGAAVSFGFVDSQPQDQRSLNCPDVQSIIKCICPRTFTRLVINKGLLHSDSIVKHGTLRLVLETLKLLDSLIHALSNTSHSSLKQEILNEVRVLLPDPQVLLSLLSSLHSRYKSPNSHLKRAADSEVVLEDNLNATKKLKTCSLNEEADILVGGISYSPEIDLPRENEEALGTDNADGFNDVVDHIAVIWGLDRCALKDEEAYFYSKLLDTLKIYHRTMPTVLEGSFDFFKVLPSNALALPTILQQSLLSLLIQHIGWSSARKIPARSQPLMYRHLHAFITLLICSPISDVRDQAYVLARAAMLSTGAFDNNEKEISAWFLFLPGYNSDNVSIDMFHKLSSVVSFLCDAVSTIGNNLFKYWNLLRGHIYNLKGTKDVPPSFSPLVLVVLEKCLRILNSESGNLSLPEKSMISLYVSNTLSYLLQTQVEAGLLSSLVSLILSERLEYQLSVVDISDDFCEWRPLKNLLLFVKSVTDEKTCTISSNDSEVESIADGSFSNSLDAVKRVVSCGYDDGLSGITTAFLFSMLCTPPSEVLRYCPSVISISHRLQGVPFPLLFSIFFLERHLLIDVSKLWPEMFFTGLERAVIKANEEEMKEDVIGKIDSDSTESVSSAFCCFLKRAPFYVLFPAIVSTDFSYLLGHSKLQDLLLAKLSEGTPDDLISSLSLVLFWFHKVQLSYALKAVDALEKLSDMCFVLIDKMLGKIFAEKIDSKDAQEVAEIVFCHPSVMALLECPLSGNGKFTEEIFGECTGNFTLLAKQGLDKIDLNVLNILATTLDHVFACCNSQTSVGEVDSINNKQTVKAFKSLVQKLFMILWDRLDGCIKTETNLLPLIPTLVTLHDVINFLSPFDLLELVNWIFSRIDLLEESTVWASSKNSALSVGLRIACCAFDLLSAYLQQPYAKEKAFNTWEIDDKKFDVALFERILFHLVEIVSRFELDVADLCLLKAINVANTRKVVQKHCLPFCVVLSRLQVSTPMKVVVSHCINRPSLTKAQLLLNLTELNPQHLSLFGRFLSDLMNKSLLPGGNMTTSDDHFMMLLPTALLFLASTRVKFGERFYFKNLTNIASFYWRILSCGFSNWKSYISRNIFQVESSVLPSSLEELIDFVNNTLLGKSVLMFRYYFVSCGVPLKLKKRLKLFDSICPYSAPDDDLLDCHVSEIDAYSSNHCLNLIVKAAAKIYVCRMLLFPEEIKVDGDTKESTSEAGSSKEHLSRIRFLNMLARTWHLIVKKFPLNSKGLSKGECTSCSFLRFFEVFILRSILDLTAKLRNCLLNPNSLPYIEQLARSSLLYRFEDNLAIRMLRSVLSISEGKFSPNLVLQLLLAHSQFVPIILSTQMSSGSSQFGLIFKPMSSILRSLVIYSPNQNAPNEENNLQLEVVKLLRVLFHVKAHQGGSDSDKDDHTAINSRELLLLLLSSYGATLSEVDLEIYNLMNEIESNEELKSGNIAEVDYLWGSAAINNIRREREREKDMVSGEGVEERRRNQFRENFPIDPRLCANTVLYFPYDRTIDGRRTSSPSNVEQSNAEHIPEKAHSTTIEKRQRYDPVFILRVSIHCLSLGYVEPMEFASLGLLAIAFVSISSPDYEIRKLAYEAIGRFKSALEKSKKRKDVMRLRLLLTYLQNGIEEAWQRIPSISSIFVAEASFLLLDPSHNHYLIISKMLVRTPRMSMKLIPLFHDFFWSSSVTFKTDRLWILRLLYTGLNLDEDAHIYIKNSVLEILLSFYASPLSDNESKELILQIVKKSLKLHKISRHLVENCCLISWLSSIVSFFCGRQYQHQRSFSVTHFTVVLEVVSDVISSRQAMEWLQKYALEQLTELSSQLYKLLTGDIKLREDVHLVTTILRILTLTLKISQKRKVYQPHFTLSVHGLFQIFEVVDAFSIGGHSPCAEFGLKAVLMSTPSAAILCMNHHEKLLKFVMWAISIALHSKSTQERQCGESYQHFTVFSEEEEQSEDDSLASKLLRWLTASVILGQKSNYLDSNSLVQRNNDQTLQSLLENTEKGSGENQGGISSEERIIIGGAILYLQQQLLRMDCRVLPSSVSALCLLLSSDPVLSDSDLFHGAGSPLATSLLRRIHSPVEANPSWRWSYYQPWKDVVLSFEEATTTTTTTTTNGDAEKMEEIHACQTLLLLFSNLFDKKQQQQQQLSLHSQLQDLEDSSGVFQWERNTLETPRVIL